MKKAFINTATELQEADLALKDKLMALADEQEQREGDSLDSADIGSNLSLNAKKRRKTINAEVEEFIQKMLPDTQVTKIDLD